MLDEVHKYCEESSSPIGLMRSPLTYQHSTVLLPVIRSSCAPLPPQILSSGLLFNGPSSYLRSGGNVVDCLTVLGSAIALIVEAVVSGADATWLRAVRVLRALRPLRAFTYIHGA